MSFDFKNEDIQGSDAQGLESIDAQLSRLSTNFERVFEKPTGLAAGDVFYVNSSGELVRVAIGSSGQVLTVSSGVPAWSTTAAADSTRYVNQDTRATWGFNCVGTTVNEWGVPVSTTAGTLANGNSTDAAWVQFTTGTAAGNTAGFNAGSANLTRRQHDPLYFFRVKTGSDISSQRIWIGLSTSTGVHDNNSIAAKGISGAMFRYSTDAGDTKWVGVCSNGTTQTVSAGIGSDIVLSTAYTLTIRVDSTNAKVHFSVDGGTTETEVSTNLPATTTQLGHFNRIETRVAAARHFLVNRGWCRSNG